MVVMEEQKSGRKSEAKPFKPKAVRDKLGKVSILINNFLFVTWSDFHY